MPTLDPSLEIGGENGNTDTAVRARAVYGAGFAGPVAHSLIMSGKTLAQFDAALKEAKEMQALVRLCAPKFDGIDNDVAVNHAITHGIPLATVRKDIINLMAQLDEDAQVNTARKAGPGARTSEQTSAVYAQREAQIDAMKGKHG